jgi:hypothetical protein
LPATLNTATASPNGSFSTDPGLAPHAAITRSRSEIGHHLLTCSAARPARSGLPAPVPGR